MSKEASWQQADPPLDKGRRQWIAVRGRANMKVVFGECNMCGNDTYDEDEDVPNRLYSSKHGVYFGQNICHRCWVKSESLNSGL